MNIKKSIHYVYVNRPCQNEIHSCVYLIYTNKILLERKQQMLAILVRV